MGKHRKVPPPPSIPGLVDAHCHLDYPPMADDVDATLARARAAGVEQVVHIACRREAFTGAVALIEAHPQVFAAVGVHPHDATTLDDATLAEIEAIVRRYPGRVVAVGETGLDYYY
ncbi:MAG: TatD family hydrolase, partial [Myxococcales bacterium]|nr:TatD family hydrolase [Myxococcales bacterium]